MVSTASSERKPATCTVLPVARKSAAGEVKLIWGATRSTVKRRSTGGERWPRRSTTLTARLTSPSSKSKRGSHSAPPGTAEQSIASRSPSRVNASRSGATRRPSGAAIRSAIGGAWAPMAAPSGGNSIASSTSGSGVSADLAKPGASRNGETCRSPPPEKAAAPRSAPPGRDRRASASSLRPRSPGPT